MDNLPVEVIKKMYSYDNTYKIKIGKVLTQLTAHCFIYNCRICFKPYNNCWLLCCLQNVPKIMPTDIFR